MQESSKPPIFLSDKYCMIVLLLNCLVSSLYLLRVHVVAKVATTAPEQAQMSAGAIVLIRIAIETLL
jgi:hypothetical protein